MLQVVKLGLDPPVIKIDLAIPLALWRRTHAHLATRGVARLRGVMLAALEKEVVALEAAAAQTNERKV
jgi:hypothetical protein